MVPERPSESQSHAKAEDALMAEPPERPARSRRKRWMVIAGVLTGLYAAFYGIFGANFIAASCSLARFHGDVARANSFECRWGPPLLGVAGYLAAIASLIGGAFAVVAARRRRS